MNLFMSDGVKKSLKDFDDGLDKYFASAQKYRSSVRQGSIVLLDNDDDLFCLFRFLAAKCNLKGHIVHVKESKLASKAVEDLGASNVKAVVIDESMLENSMNGDSFTFWIEEKYPKIPVWVINCNKERQTWIKQQSKRVGVIDFEVTLASMVETVGFPSGCKEMVYEYTH